MIHIKQIQATDCYPIRKQVLWQHKAVAECGIDIDEQDGVFHLGAFLNNELVCIGSFFKQKNPNFHQAHQYRLRAMATLPSAQKKGTAKSLVKFAVKKLQSENIDLLWCDARIVATGFYNQLGFSMKGNAYEIPIIGTHYLMYKHLEGK
jgi:GNAT superfamily N-acetyltransferase